MDQAADALAKGDYQKAIALSEDGMTSDPRAAIVGMRAMLANGHYHEAAEAAKHTSGLFPGEAAVHLARFEALKASGFTPEASEALMIAARTQPGAYDPQDETPVNAAARARALQKLGADPRQTLDRILNPAIKANPQVRELYLALGETALEKSDNLLASETFREANNRMPGDADILYGLARSLDAPELVSQYLAAALKANPRHIPTLLYKAREFIDADDLDEAAQTLAEIEKINPAQPDAWALRALVAQLRGDSKTAETARAKALALWRENPEIDYQIGTGLARHYRFQEAIDTLRSALAMDPNHLPSHFELGSNLLRFGNEAEGWSHVERVLNRDPYHVAAFNLMTLREAMAKMQTLHGGGVNLRLSATDLALFGPRALELCEKARKTFSEKYGVNLPFDVTVDILPNQQDFAVRTFTLPGGEGFLGVCFGPLITATSPRTRLGRANWEAVLWHEMAHTITLTGSRHRIPRWLSEGFSVHEENLAHAGWGMGMNTERRKLILDGKQPPVLESEAIFRKNIDFAYFRSGLFVDFLESRIGVDGLRQLLAELNADHPVAQALETVAGPIPKLQEDFDRYTKDLAEAYGRNLDWKPLDDAEFQSLRANPTAFLAAQPHRYFAVMDQAHQLARAQKWAEVRDLLNPLVALEPNNREPDNPYLLLAEAQRNLGDAGAERTALERMIALDAGSLPAAERLLELAGAPGPESAKAAARVLAINPAHPAALLALARSDAAGGNTEDAIADYEAFLATKPLDGARVRLELAQALHARHDSRARRQVLLALEENPRLESALQLLQTLHHEQATP
jgi:Tfp pilus assembly protein PilF